MHHRLRNLYRPTSHTLSPSNAFITQFKTQLNSNDLATPVPELQNLSKHQCYKNSPGLPRLLLYFFLVNSNVYRLIRCYSLFTCLLFKLVSFAVIFCKMLVVNHCRSTPLTWLQTLEQRSSSFCDSLLLQFITLCIHMHTHAHTHMNTHSRAHVYTHMHTHVHIYTHSWRVYLTSILCCYIFKESLINIHELWKLYTC